MLSDAGRYGEAIAVFDDALRRTRMRPAALLGRARALAESGRDREALAGYRQLLEIWKEADATHPGMRALKAYLDRDGSRPTAGGQR
jgi:tetratricopeptide (TPR) repeat protein